MADARKISLRTYVYLDVLQPQLASFLATVSQGYLPIERHVGGLERLVGEPVDGDARLHLDEQRGLLLDRLQPRVVTSEIITGTSPYQTMLINRFRHGDQLLKGQALYILETHPAGYAILAANEAEKASPIRLLEVVTFGAYGRLYLGGGDDEIKEAAAAAEAWRGASRGCRAPGP